MNRLRVIYNNRWVRFAVVALLYTLMFVVWSGIWWSIIGLVVIFDIYISKFYYRLYWKKHLEKKTKSSTYRNISGWVEAIIFAVVVASLVRIYFVEMYVIPSPSMERTLLVGDYIGVSKVAYGPKLPNTPLSMPFVHNINPFDNTKKSYVEWIKRPYRRLAGCDTIKHNDVVVFNYPEGDTIMVFSPQDNYYRTKQDYGVEAIRSQTALMVHPVDKRDNYIKRAIGLPGDNLEIKNADIYINGELKEKQPFMSVREYFVRHKSEKMPRVLLERLDIRESDIISTRPNLTKLYLTPTQVQEMPKSSEIIELMPKISTDIASEYSGRIFPRDAQYSSWTEDNFGPIWIPRRGATIKLDSKNLPLYRRAIQTYEGNELRVEGEDIYINGAKTDSYTFKMNYFFMMGDNRHNSLDSRYWGFVPEDHIVGKASFIWFSKEQGKGLFGGIRFGRIFTKIK